MERIYEAIDIHNDMVDAMQELAATLIGTYPGVEDTPVNEAFLAVWQKMTNEAVFLCCEANAKDGGGWTTTGNWMVMREEDVEA